MYMYTFFLRKSDCLGCAVLLCLVVCLTLLASFFLPSHLSLKHIHVHYVCVCVCVCMCVFGYMETWLLQSLRISVQP